MKCDNVACKLPQTVWDAFMSTLSQTSDFMMERYGRSYDIRLEKHKPTFDANTTMRSMRNKNVEHLL